MMQDATVPARQLPHPLQLDVEYPERLSRGLIFIKWLLVIPHAIAVYLLLIAVYILTILAWFAILFTGRYPKAFFEFNAGVLRWMSNTFAYFALLRDEYPPFSWEPGEYPLDLVLERAARQSRFRLIIRGFAIIPNYIVLSFVQIGWYFTTFISWWAILFTGRYPRGLFRFSVGVMRWYQRQFAYLLLLRDEYPPYSINAEARPGNEVVSTIIGLPIGVAYLGFYVMFSILPLIDGGETVNVRRALLDSPSALAAEHPSGSAAGVRLTLLQYDEEVEWWSSDAPFDVAPPYVAGYEWDLVSFTVLAEKDGFVPTFYTPFLFNVEVCGDYLTYQEFEATFEENDWFELFITGGREESTIYFWVPVGTRPCRLNYYGGASQIHFRFQ
jgi:hypothetical protein